MLNHTTNGSYTTQDMIRVEPISDEQWLVTVEGITTTKHRVGLSSEILHRIGGGTLTADAVLDASFRFLLDREPNTAILPMFDLMLIGQYFPEYEKEIARYLAPHASHRWQGAARFQAAAGGVLENAPP